MSLAHNCRDCGEQVHVSGGGHDTCPECVEKMRVSCSELARGTPMTTTPKIGRCSTCLFSPMGKSECRRHAPAYDPAEPHHAKWPCVYNDGCGFSCGDWVPKKEDKEPWSAIIQSLGELAQAEAIERMRGDKKELQ